MRNDNISAEYYIKGVEVQVRILSETTNDFFTYGKKNIEVLNIVPIKQCLKINNLCYTSAFVMF